MAIEQTPENLQKFAEILQRNGNNATAAAREFGIHESSGKRWRQKAIRQGIIDPFLGLVPEGFEVKSTTELYDAAGELKQRSIKMGDPVGEVFKLPEGHSVKGVSARVDGQNNVLGGWIKTDRTKPTHETIIKATKAAFENWQPSRPALIIPKASNDDMMIVYPVLDWHLGMFAWGEETGGPDWDLGIAKKVLVDHFAELVDEAPKASHATLMGLGDLLHADNSQNRTMRSGNALDVDTRYSKVLETAAEVVIECCEMIASKHRNTKVVIKRGNHDDESTVALRLAMRIEYRKSKHVAVDNSKTEFYYDRFGINLLGGTHGDEQKPADLPLHMANNSGGNWDNTSSRHYFTGHIHHEVAKEIGGVRVYSLRAPIPQDAYHAGVGYLSGQSMYAFKFHKEKGSRGRVEVEVAA